VKKFNKIEMTLKVDPVSDEYIIAVPESYVNELNWYEDTEINITLSEDGLFIEEK
jgi:antitoxin component of MazEF toxin-antitoxin module